MRTRFVNEVEEETTFSFCAPKEDNEVEENNERNFLENMSRFVNEAEDEKLYVLKIKRKKGIFVSTRSTFLLFCKYEGYFNPFNQLTHILILARKRPERCVVIKTVRCY